MTTTLGKRRPEKPLSALTTETFVQPMGSTQPRRSVTRPPRLQYLRERNGFGWNRFRAHKPSSPLPDGPTQFPDYGKLGASDGTNSQSMLGFVRDLTQAAHRNTAPRLFEYKTLNSRLSNPLLRNRCNIWPIMEPIHRGTSPPDPRHHDAPELGTRTDPPSQPKPDARISRGPPPRQRARSFRARTLFVAIIDTIAWMKRAGAASACGDPHHYRPRPSLPTPTPGPPPPCIAGQSCVTPPRARARPRPPRAVDSDASIFVNPKPFATGQRMFPKYPAL